MAVMHLSLETVSIYLFYYYFPHVVLLYHVLLLICVCYFCCSSPYFRVQIKGYKPSLLSAWCIQQWINDIILSRITMRSISVPCLSRNSDWYSNKSLCLLIKDNNLLYISFSKIFENTGLIDTWRHDHQHASTHFHGCTKYEQDPLYIFGSSVVDSAGPEQQSVCINRFTKGLEQNFTIGIQVIAWYWTGDKSIYASMVILFVCAIWCYQWPLLLTWFNFNPSMDK